MSHAEIKLLF